MKLDRLHHVRVRSSDLQATERFALDFGLLTVSRDDERLVMRTAGGDSFCYIVDRAQNPGLVGFGLEVESESDLDEVVRTSCATIHEENLGSLRWRAARLIDPDGFQVDLVAGLKRDTGAKPAPDLELNSPALRKRLGSGQHKRDLNAPHLFRLGHIGLFVQSFARSAAWYQEKLGLIPSDVYHIPGNPAVRIVGFLRLNRGLEWVDHHVLALFQRDKPDLHHLSFEVQDFETQFMTHRWLQGRGYESVWGVGRHPHGSHVFDVWRDPNGFRLETFSDTDLLNSERPTAVHDISKEKLDIWSSDPPDRYFA
jgi:catechol 2,3-dioxygenase-like lactoylglutathione lyase family enzyme